MEKPAPTYLDNPIETPDGFKIHYTHQGAIHMAKHYNAMLPAAAPTIKPFMLECLARVEKCIQYYESLPLGGEKEGGCITYPNPLRQTSKQR